ncbi:MAG: hypothetical protein WAK60_08280 [Sedimentisphaerales bacterium]
MNEAKFRQELKERLGKNLEGGYSIKENENLIYKVIIDGNLEYKQNDPKNPKRGNYAFQTDLVIGRKNGNSFLPLVVIETKYEGFSTHDVLTYSTKALKHKEIYPYVRYGLVVGGNDKIDNRFFTHNIGFDFAIALQNVDKQGIQKVSDVIVEKQLKIAELILDIFGGRRRKVKSYNAIVEIE